MTTERVGVDGKRDPEQPPLIPLSEEEMRKAAKKLAIRIAELSTMEEEHKKERDLRKTQRKAASREIAAIASTIRLEGR